MLNINILAFIKRICLISQIIIMFKYQKQHYLLKRDNKKHFYIHLIRVQALSKTKKNKKIYFFGFILIYSNVQQSIYFFQVHGKYNVVYSFSNVSQHKPRLLIHKVCSLNYCKATGYTITRIYVVSKF